MHIAYLNQGANYRAANSSSHSLPDEPSIGRRAAHSVFERGAMARRIGEADVVLQKGLRMRALRGADLLRRRVYAHCGIRPTRRPTAARRLPWRRQRSPDSALVQRHACVRVAAARPSPARGVCPKQDEEEASALIERHRE